MKINFKNEKLIFLYIKFRVTIKHIALRLSAICEISSATETIEGSALSLESIDDIESSDGLSLGVFSVSNWVTDDVFEEWSEDNSGLVIDEGRDSLDTSSSGKSSNSWLGDSKDGVLDGFLSKSLGTLFTWDFTEFSSFGSLYWGHYLINYYYFLIN